MAKRTRRSFGGLRKLPSGRWQANYTGPDGRLHKAPRTYPSKDEAIGWLNHERRLIDLDAWTPPAQRAAENRPAPRLTLAAYGTQWIAQRKLKETTRELYSGMFTRYVEHDEIATVPLTELTPERIRVWYSELVAQPGPNKRATGKTRNARVYALLKTILGTAVDDGIIDANPCRIPRAGRAERSSEIRLLTTDELAALTAEMPDHLQVLVTVGAWCGMRRGELLELRRGDIEPDASVIRIRRAVTFVGGDEVVGKPKSSAGIRDVVTPPHIRPAILDHLDAHVGKGARALVFTHKGGRVDEWTLRFYFKRAAERIGRADVRLHDLRHLGAVMAAQAGATTKELMARLGHTTPAMSMKYQHVAQGRDAQIAERLSKLAGGDTP
ncbi:tyrosine-type recombinase/integrase [Tomitella gaofuii]|uniref:tyrosine-type recombinase/integrase n=1 Tax=Tomitella gaofuii TaxID=2760083 RepID=UPI0015FA2C40|nr:site-specific integrase [Tomitella gaofuii]